MYFSDFCFAVYNLRRTLLCINKTITARAPQQTQILPPKPKSDRRASRVPLKKYYSKYDSSEVQRKLIIPHCLSNPGVTSWIPLCQDCSDTEVLRFLLEPAFPLPSYLTRLNVPFVTSYLYITYVTVSATPSETIPETTQKVSFSETQSEAM